MQLRLLFLCFIAVAVLSFRFSAATVQDSCKAITERHEDITEEFCVKHLNEASQSTKSEDPSQLAAGVTKLAITSVESTTTQIDELVKHEGNEKLKNGMTQCIDIYNEAIGSVKNAADDISKNAYGKAITHLRISLYAGELCKEVFHDMNVQCPQPRVMGNQEYGQLAQVAIDLLLGVK